MCLRVDHRLDAFLPFAQIHQLREHEDWARPPLPPRGFRALRFPSCDASAEVTARLAGWVDPAGTRDLLLRGECVGDKSPALFSESGLCFKRGSGHGDGPLKVLLYNVAPGCPSIFSAS